MSMFGSLTWQNWLGQLSRESLIVDHLPYDETGEHATHLEAFVRATGASEGLESRPIQRLLAITHQLLHLRILFDSASVKLFYGPDVFTQLIHALYGPTVEEALAFGTSQRRLLLESEDVYSAEQLAMLIIRVINGDGTSEVHRSSWSNAHAQNLFDSSSRGSTQRAYEIHGQKKYWILDDPHGLEPAESVVIAGVSKDAYSSVRCCTTADNHGKSDERFTH